MSNQVIKVIILDGGLTAKEINQVTNPNMGERHINYEKTLRTFQIENKVVSFVLWLLIEKDGNNDGCFVSAVGVKHNAEVLANGKIKII